MSTIRLQLYSLIEKGQEAVNGILELSQESDSPRAYEVAGQLIKNVADATDKLIDLQQKMKDLNKEDAKGPNSVTNNALFIGSISTCKKFLKMVGLVKKRNSARKELEQALTNMLKVGALNKESLKLKSPDITAKELRSSSELQMILLALRKVKMVNQATYILVIPI